MAALQPEDKKRIYKEGGAPLQLCQQPTNGLSYLRMVADVSQLPDNLKSWLPLFSSVLTKMGAGAWDFRELDQMAERRTSGLSSSLHLVESSSQSFSQGIVLSSSCDDPNLDTMVDIWTQVLNSPRFQDADRLHELVKSAAYGLAQGIVNDGDEYAVKLAASTLSPYAAARERYEGLAQVLQMKELAEKFDADLFLAQLKEIAGIIFRKNNLRFALNGSHSSLERGQHLLENLLTSLPASTSQTGSSDAATFQPAGHRTHFVMPHDIFTMGKCIARINTFVGRAKSTPAGLADPGSHANLKVAAQLLASQFLRSCIQEQGGACDSGASVSRGGLFSLYSYRDLKVNNTMETFNKSIDWLLDPKSYTDQDLEEAKLGVLQEIDAPISPEDKGMSHFLFGVTDDMMQSVKSSVLTATRQSLTDTVSRCLGTPGPLGESLLGPEWLTTQRQGWTRRSAE